MLIAQSRDWLDRILDDDFNSGQQRAKIHIIMFHRISSQGGARNEKDSSRIVATVVLPAADQLVSPLPRLASTSALMSLQHQKQMPQLQSFQQLQQVQLLHHQHQQQQQELQQRKEQQQLAAINRSLLESFYIFRPGAPLKNFFMMKLTVVRESYTLTEVLTILKEIIKNELLFDQRNPAIILCSKELDAALNMRALHVTEIREVVTMQLFPLPEKNQVALQEAAAHSRLSAGKDMELIPLRQPPPATVSEAKTSTGSAAAVAAESAVPHQTGGDVPVPVPKLDPKVFADKSARFELKPDFRAVLATLPDFDPNQTSFPYEQVTMMLSKYILSKKETFFDPRNVKVALVANDPLGKAFQLDAFHRCQVTTLLRKQLILVASGDSKTSSSVLEPGDALPPFPTLTKAATLPAAVESSSSSCPGSPTAKLLPRGILRKISYSEDELQSKQRKLTNDAPALSRENSSSESESEEEHEPEQEGEDDDDGTSSGVYEVEYDVDSSEEQEERPPQAGGGGNESSEEDSDPECQTEPVHEVELDKSETENWADSEPELIALPEIELVNKRECSECTRCRTPTGQALPYCDDCWQARKSWLPERPRHHRKRRHPEASSSEDTDTAAAAMTTAAAKIALVAAGSGDTGSSQDSGFGSPPEWDSPLVLESKNVNGSCEPADTGEETFQGRAAVGTQCGLSGTADEFLLRKALEAQHSLTALMQELGNHEAKGMAAISEVLSHLKKQIKMVDLMPPTNAVSPPLCMFCCQRPKNASLIHGQIGHQVCCYPCGKKLWKKQARCPVCRRKVEKIVKVILA